VYIKLSLCRPRRRVGKCRYGYRHS